LTGSVVAVGYDGELKSKIIGITRAYRAPSALFYV
jgi:hypothetical protein